MTKCSRMARRVAGMRADGAFGVRARIGRSAMLVAALLATACEFPTTTPRFESRFLVPLEATRMAVSELLPSGVTVVGDQFRVTVAAAATQRTLGQICGSPCIALQGQQAPKPAFSFAFDIAQALPADVQGAVISEGTATVTLSHSFDFDPLRPPGATQNGTISITVRSGGETLGSATIDQAFPRITPITRSVQLAGRVSGGIEVVIAIVSPAGGTVLISNSAPMSVSLAATVVSASEAQVVVTNRPVTVRPASLDLTGIDEGVRDRVRRGALVLEIANPFAVTGVLQLRLHAAASGADIRRTLQVQPDRTTQRIDLTKEEIQSLLGHSVTATVTGPVSAPGGTITVRPDQQLVLTPRLDVFLEFGSEP
jgi:hypothetical protein